MRATPPLPDMAGCSYRLVHSTASSRAAWRPPTPTLRRSCSAPPAGPRTCDHSADSRQSEQVPPDQRAHLMAGLGAMTGVSFLFGPPIGAGLANLGGVTAPFLVGSATSVCAAAVAFFNFLSPSRLKEVNRILAPSFFWPRRCSSAPLTTKYRSCPSLGREAG